MIVLAAIYSLTALKNRLREGLRRLGQPRYALGLLALLVYLAMIFGPSLYFGRPGGARATPVPRGPEIGIGVYVAVLWTLWRSGKTPAVNMQRSELMFLVTAPVTRRQVLLFWIVNHQPRLLLSGLGVAVFGWLWHWDPISTWVACWAVLNAWMALTLVGHQVWA